MSLAKLGYAVKPSGPEEVTRVIRDGMLRWKDVVAKAKVSMD